MIYKGRKELVLKSEQISKGCLKGTKTKNNINFQTEAGLPFEHRGANIFVQKNQWEYGITIRTGVPKFVQEVKY